MKQSDYNSRYNSDFNADYKDDFAMPQNDFADNGAMQAGNNARIGVSLHSKKYKVLPITMLGILLFAALMGGLALVWAAVCYLLKLEPADYAYIAYICYYLPLLCGCILAAALCRGMTLLPALLTALFALASNYILAGSNITDWKVFSIKIISSLAIALITSLLARGIGRRENRDYNKHSELKF